MSCAKYLTRLAYSCDNSAQQKGREHKKMNCDVSYRQRKKLTYKLTINFFTNKFYFSIIKFRIIQAAIYLNITGYLFNIKEKSSRKFKRANLNKSCQVTSNYWKT